MRKDTVSLSSQHTTSAHYDDRLDGKEEDYQKRKIIGAILCCCEYTTTIHDDMHSC